MLSLHFALQIKLEINWSKIPILIKYYAIEVLKDLYIVGR